MEGSIEMKMQALNEMLDVREQMNDMLGKLEFYYLQAGESTNVLFRNKEEFFEYANYINAEIVLEQKDDEDEHTRVSFRYRDVEFLIYLKPDELRQHEHELHEIKEEASTNAAGDLQK